MIFVHDSNICVDRHIPKLLSQEAIDTQGAIRLINRNWKLFSDTILSALLWSCVRRVDCSSRKRKKGQNLCIHFRGGGDPDISPDWLGNSHVTSAIFRWALLLIPSIPTNMTAATNR